MNEGQNIICRALVILLVLPTAMSCGSRALPDVPEFGALGFADALEPVQRQVQAAYEDWQEEPRVANRNGYLGMLLAAYDRNSAAEVLFRRAHLIAPDEFRWIYYLARTLEELGRHAEAADAFDAALEIDPDFSEARIQFARVLLQLGNVEDSVGQFRAISERVPSRVEGWLGLGKALDRSGDRRGAVAALQRAAQVGPQYGEVHYVLASVLAASGDDAAAAREFAIYERTKGNKLKSTDYLTREILVLHAGDAPHIGAAQQHLAQGQLTAAIASIQRALTINRLRADSWSMLIYLHARNGDIGQAGEVYRQAQAAGISYARLHLTYGKALLEHRRYDEARNILGKALEIDPQYPEALAAMAELGQTESQ